MPHSTYQKLVITAAGLFQKKGYAKTTIAEILKASSLPRGSLYHHFPGGKKDLAIASARWSSSEIVKMIEQVFADARSSEKRFVEGVVDLCLRLARVFEDEEAWVCSPVLAMLMDGEDDERMRAVAIEMFCDWKAAFLRQGLAFGLERAEIRMIGEKLLLLLEGAWMLSRTTGEATAIHQVAEIMQREHG